MNSLHKFSEIWNRYKVKMKKKVQLYGALVKSILTYNCGTWGMSKTDEDKFDSFHRQQLRHTLNIKYPHKIRSKQLYTITKTHPISADIARARWRMLGHTLRMKENTPARRAMKFFFENTGGKKFRGKKRTTIVTTINKDIERTKKKFPLFDIKPLKSLLDLHNARVKAKNKGLWRKRVNMVFEAAYSLKLKNL